METYNKITVGFVTQSFRKDKNGRFICFEQSFVTGDEVDYEDNFENHVEVDESLEVYAPFFMKQPKLRK